MCQVVEIQTNSLQSYVESRYDPTRTTTLRNRFVRDMRSRFRELESVIRISLVERDAFGLVTQQMTPANRNQFNFPTDPQKVQAFLDWLDQQVKRGILDVRDIPGAVNDPNGYWFNKYIFDSYRRGVINGRNQMRKSGVDVPPLADTGGIEASMSGPFHADRVGLLYIRNYNELQNITTTMSNQVSKVLAQGMADGDGPARLSRKLISTINGEGMGDLGITDTLGRYIPAKRRAEMLARTEIIRAHHLGTINEYESWGMVDVQVIAEFESTDDGRVCPICRELDGQQFSLERIRGMIPVHPNCRCTTVPVIKN